MERCRKIAVFDSFEESARAERLFHASLTPEERLDILLDLISTYGQGADGEVAEGFARVHRIVELARR